MLTLQSVTGYAISTIRDVLTLVDNSLMDALPYYFYCDQDKRAFVAVDDISRLDTLSSFMSEQSQETSISTLSCDSFDSLRGSPPPVVCLPLCLSPSCLYVCGGICVTERECIEGNVTC